MSGERLVSVRRDGEVAVLTLDRERKLNALSAALERDLDAALASPEVRESRAVVVAGRGRAFSAGADRDEMRGVSPEEIAAYYRDTGEVYERFAALPQATIAAVHGYCLGGGLELALAADFRIADETAVLGLPEVEIGILPSSGGTHRLVRLLGAARARELALLRRRVDAPAALAAGLVTEVVAAGGAVGRALAIARELAVLPPLAVAVTKQSIDAMAESSRPAGLLLERLGYAMLAQTDEARAAGEAFGRGRARADG